MKTFKYLRELPKLKTLPTEEIGGKRFYISPNGIKLPSVTTVLGHFKRQQLREWRDRVGEEEANRISNRAAIRGTKFHNIIERYLKNHHLIEGVNLLEDIMPDMKIMFRNMEKTLEKIDNIHYIEATLYSETLGIAGRADVVGEYDGVLSIIDFKTSNRLKSEEHIRSYFEQATAYSEMYYELTGRSINQIVIIIAVDNEPAPQCFIKNRHDYVDSLLRKIYTYQKENSHVS